MLGSARQTERLVKALRREGISANWISFPRHGETPAAKVIGRYLNGEFGPLESIPYHLPALLFAEDRFQSKAKLEDLCTTYQVVIVDRYVSSNLAYQGARLPAPERSSFFDWLTNIEYSINGLPVPDLTLYLDVPVNVSRKLVAIKEARSYTEKVLDLHERNSQFLLECRALYWDLYKRQHRSKWVSIECTKKGVMRTIIDIHEEVLEKVQGASGFPGK